jgi:hypothetical protein
MIEMRREHDHLVLERRIRAFERPTTFSLSIFQTSESWWRETLAPTAPLGTGLPAASAAAIFAHLSLPAGEQLGGARLAEHADAGMRLP